MKMEVPPTASLEAPTPVVEAAVAPPTQIPLGAPRMKMEVPATAVRAESGITDDCFIEIGSEAREDLIAEIEEEAASFEEQYKDFKADKCADEDPLNHMDLCAGAVGAFTHAYRRLGMPSTRFVEIDDDARGVYKATHKGVEQTSSGDVLKVHPRELCTASLRSPFLWTAGFPCQCVSLIGKQESVEGIQGRVGFGIINQAKLAKPVWILFENVNSLLNASLLSKTSNGVADGSFLEFFMRSLNEAGYVASVFKVNAEHLGIPQKRIRIFIICVRKDGYRGMDGDKLMTAYVDEAKTKGGLLYDAMRCQQASLREHLNKESHNCWHLKKKSIAAWQTRQQETHVVSLGALCASNTIPRTYAQNGYFGTFIAIAPQLEDKTGKLSYEDYKDLLHPENSELSTVRQLDMGELFAIFDIRQNERPNFDNFSFTRTFRQAALGNSVPVGQAELFLETILKVSPKVKYTPDAETLTRREKLREQYPTPLILKEKETKGDVSYYEWVTQHR